jgi:DNA (cytosine-5)-methyltransferase 1
MSRPVTVAEYFAGIGLVRMGLEPLGWQVVFANDFSADKYALYSEFFPNSEREYVIKDVFELDSRATPPTLLATCSFPCIDLSLAGNREGITGKHSSAFWGFHRMLTEQGAARPPLILVENVPGWLSSNGGLDFRTTVSALNQLGYWCDVFTLDARRFTPQSRLRVFLVGARLESGQNDAARLLLRSPSLLSKGLATVVTANADLQWFCLPLPEPPPLLHAGLSDLVEKLPPSDARWWSDKETQRHLAMMSSAHRERVLQLSAQEGLRFRTFYRRRREEGQRAEVRDDDVAGCLRTAVGGSGKQFLIQAGNGLLRMRTMTAREYARLQGVPDRYPVFENGVKTLTAYGDAVCVLAISWVAEHALNPLAKCCTIGSNVRLPQDAG